jgi:hypothetical protein
MDYMNIDYDQYDNRYIFVDTDIDNVNEIKRPDYYPLLKIEFEPFDHDQAIKQLDLMKSIYNENSKFKTKYYKEQDMLKTNKKLRDKIQDQIKQIQTSKKSITHDYKQLSILVGKYNNNADYLYKHGYDQMKVIGKQHHRPSKKLHKEILDKKISIISLENTDEEKLFIYCKSRRLIHAILHSEIKIFIEILRDTHNYHLNKDDEELYFKCMYPTSGNNKCNKLHLWKNLIDKLDSKDIKFANQMRKLLDKKYVELYGIKHGVENICYCINKSCEISETGFICKNDTIINSLRTCPECDTNFCFICKDAYHYHSPCPGPIKDSVDNETYEYLKLNAVVCPNPKCKTTLTKDVGCNHLICIKCKTHLCFRCGGIRDSFDPYCHVCPSGYSRQLDPSEHPDIYLPIAYNANNHY